MTMQKPSRNEEEYFARREAELARQTREAARNATLEAERRTHYMKCPKCGFDLVTGTWEGVDIDQCTNCQGIWLDKGEAESLLRHAPEGAIAKIIRSLLRGTTARA